ncbi:MAG: ABC transporter ATP-binding protein [Bacillota bacterium]
MAEVLLNIDDLHIGYRVYKGTLKVLDGIRLVVHTGEKVGVVGETGCGKTTTMRAVMGILPRQAIIKGGRITFKGKDVMVCGPQGIRTVRTEGMSMIFQDPTAALNPVFTVGEQLADVIKYSHVGRGLERRGAQQAITAMSIEALKQTALPDPQRIITNYPFQLSGGMRQRVCISMALVTARDLLIADEPTTNLDVTIQDQVLRLIKQLVEEKSMSLILVTHSLGVARMMSDRIYVMYAGNIVEAAPTEKVFGNPLHPYTQGLLRSVPKLTGEGIGFGIPGRIPDYFNPPAGCRFYPRCDFRLPECENEKPELYETDEGHYVACFIHR